jgi:hypothetical protein
VVNPAGVRRRRSILPREVWAVIPATGLRTSQGARITTLKSASHSSRGTYRWWWEQRAVVMTTSRDGDGAHRGRAVVVAADRHQAVKADAAFEPKEFIERQRRRGCRSGCSAANASKTMRCVMPRKLATVASQLSSWPLRSSRFRNARGRKKS